MSPPVAICPDTVTTFSAILDAAGIVGQQLVLNGAAAVNNASPRKVTVTRIGVSGLLTAAASIDVQVVKNTAALTGGTAGTAPTIVAHDSGDTALATVTNFTVAPSGGIGAALRAAKILFPAPATAGVPPLQEWDFNSVPCKGLVLRGANQSVGISLGAGAAGAGTAVALYVEWTEEGASTN